MQTPPQYALEVPSPLGVTLVFRIFPHGMAVAKGVDTLTGETVPLPSSLRTVADLVAREWFLAPDPDEPHYSTEKWYIRERGWTLDGYESAFGAQIKEQWSPVSTEEEAAVA